MKIGYKVSVKFEALKIKHQRLLLKHM